MIHSSTRRLVIALAFVLAAIVVPAILVGLVGGTGAMARTALALALGALLGLLLWLAWRGLRLFLFRVGRKLAFSYFLIGVLPIPMVLLLAGLNAYLLSGYFLGHLYRDAARELRTELGQRAAAHLAEPGDAPTPAAAGAGVALARYRGGRLVREDALFPEEWPAWMVAGDETEVPADAYFSLADGRATLAVAVGDGDRGVVAAFTGDIEDELSRRAEVLVRLFQPDDPRRESPLRLQLGERQYSLLPLIARPSVEGREEFFSAAETSGGFLDRPFLWWGEITGPLVDLTDGSRMAEFVTASLNGTPRIVARHLFSGSAEVDTAIWAGMISLTALLGSLYGISVVMALVIIFTLSRAVNRLSRATSALQRGDFSTRIPVRRRDQVGELQSSFNELAENLQMLVATAAQKEILENELEIARNLQKRLLPREVPSSGRLDFATLFEPSAAIGGDYFDILPVDERHLAVVVADVAGHGLPAGLRMAMLKAALQMLVEEGKAPDEIVHRLSDMIRGSEEKRYFVTATVASVDFREGTVDLTNAGHPPTYLVRGGEAREILLPGNPLGALGESYGHERIRLEPEDVVVWLSDGLIEATNAAGEPFGYRRLREALGGPPASAAEVRDRLVSAVAGYVGDRRPPEDDRTLVAMRYRVE